MRRIGRPTRSRCLSVTLVILSLAHVPLPVADFHVIGHLDGVGQLCPLHDHLLRWHASGNQSEKPVLHFHWAFLSTPAPDAGTPGRALRADAVDPLDIKPGELQQESAVAASVRPPVEKLAPALFIGLLSEPLAGGPSHAMDAGFVPTSRNFAATFPPHLPTNTRLQRRVC
jgi:hypothetical protein